MSFDRFAQGIARNTVVGPAMEFTDKQEADIRRMCQPNDIIERMQSLMQCHPSSRNDEADWPIPVDPADLRELIAMARIVLDR